MVQHVVGNAVPRDLSQGVHCISDVNSNQIRT